MEYIIQLLTAFFGTAGFAMFWNVDKKIIPMVAFDGFAAWLVYIVCHEWADMEIFASSFFAAATVGLIAEALARLCKKPASVFLIPGLVPLFPGSSLYYAVSAATTRNWQVFYTQGLTTVYFALGIACGAAVVSALIVSVGEIRKKRVKNT